MSKLAISGPVEPIPAPTEAAALVHMIDRAARDPAIDLVRLERLMEMRKEIRREEAESEFNQAMAVVQGKMRAVAADANNPQTRSKYASYFALDKAIRPIYSAEGIALSFDTEDSPKDDHVRVVCYVTRGAHTRKYHCDMPADGKGAKGGDVMTKTHAAGSAFTYGQRYLLKMIFNIAIGEDDDGNRANDTQAVGISAAQLKELRALIADVNADEAKVCKACHVETLEDLTVKLFTQAKAKLESMRMPQ